MLNFYANQKYIIDILRTMLVVHFREVFIVNGLLF